MKLIHVILIVLLFNAVSVFGQIDPCNKTTEGTDFWFGFMEGRQYDKTHYTEITVTSSYHCNYTIYIGKSKIPFVLPAPLNGTVQPNIPVQIRIPWQQVEATGSEVQPFQQKAIHLESDSALNVYALNFATNSSEVAMIYPTPSLGKEYYAMCYDPHYQAQNGNVLGKNSEFLIVASQDSTVVTITPKVTTANNVSVPFKIKLSQGEVYQVQSANLLNTVPPQGDLTGSYITSNYPIAVFGGSYSTTVPITSTNAWDHLYEQMPPVQSWGTKFITVPLKTRGEDFYRVLAAYDNTTVQVGNKSTYHLNHGQWQEFPLFAEPLMIQSSQPIMLAQFSASNSVDKPPGVANWDGDPFMVIISSVDQTREKVAFVAYQSIEITNKFFINVVVKDDAVGAIQIDQTIVNFTSLSGTGYSYAQVPLINTVANQAYHLIESTVSGKGFIAWVYGFGGVEAYGYGVGYNLDIVLNLGSNLGANGKLVLCDGSPPLTIDAGHAFDHYKWYTGNPGDTTSTLQVTKAGWYKLTASTTAGCIKTDSIEVIGSKQSLFLGRDTTICNPSTIVLDAGNQFQTWAWSTPTGQLNTQTIVASNPGTYSVVVTNNYGCTATDSIKVSFVNKPKIIVNRIDSLNCGKFSTVLDVSADENVTWALQSTDPKVSINGFSVSVNPADQGKYPVILTAKDTFSCVSTNTYNIGFFKSPVVNLGNDSTICNPQSIALNAGNQFARYLWSTSKTDTLSSITVKNNGIYSVNITDNNGCRASDTVKIAFTNPPSLITSNMQTLMCGKFSTLLDVSADKKVSWSLESTDPKVSINGLSVSVSPANQGTYPFILTAKDTFSCVSTKAFNLGFFKSPVVNLGSDSTICNPQSITLNAGSQFSDYTWSTSEKTQSITVKNNGTYSVNITDTNGCKTSDTVKIAFTNPPNVLNISSIDTLICGPFTTTLNLSSDKVVTYSLESANPKININGLTASVIPADFGTYPITITAKDQFSCSTSYNSKLGFYKTPAVGFTVDDKTCSGYNLDVSYVGNAVIGSSNFNWNFGGANIANGTGLSSLIVPLGINRTGRDLLLTVTEDGCSNSFTQKDIKVIPNLSMNNNDRLGCEPFTTQFSANNTEVVVYDWDFGDGTPVQRTTNQPFHTYQKAGFYNVDLKVTTIVASGAGCVNEIKTDSMIHVAPIPTVGFTPILKGICLDAGNHTISYSGSGDSLDKYIWDLSAFSSGEIVQNPNQTKGPFVFNLKNEPQATIGLKVISKYGCLSADSTVLVKRIPVFSFSSTSDAGCTPLEIIFTGAVSDPVDKLNYTWNFGDGANGSGNPADHTYTDPNHQYDILLTALSSITSCSDTSGKKGYVITRPQPDAGFQPDNKIVYNDKPTINFTNTSTGATLYSWDFGDGSTSSQINPTHDFKATGYRTVLLEAFNNYSCYDTTSLQILVAFNKIFPPNAFSPNAPNPLDQEYKLTSEGVMPEGYHLEILSRWNDIVFEARDEIKGWNGRMKNGNWAPAGNYVWILDYNDFLGRRHRQTGTVTLVF